MSKPKGIIIYFEKIQRLNCLNGDQVLELINALAEYAETGETPCFGDSALQYAFMDFADAYDRDAEKYTETVERRREAGRKSAEAKANKEQQTSTNVNKRQQNATKANKEQQTSTKSTNQNQNQNTISTNVDEEENITKEENRSKQDFDNFALCVISEFNRICLDLPEVTKLTDHRRRLLFNDGMMDKKVAEYTALFKRVHKSDYLCGRSGSWRADFDFVIKNSVKIMEGSYDNVEPKGKPPNNGGRMFSDEGASFDMDKWSGNVPEGCG